jgi:hypothetical protein
MVVEMETLAAAEPAALPADLAAQVQQQRTTWNRAVPIPTPEAKTLADRWQAALTALIQRNREAFKGTDLDADSARHRLEKLVARVETYLEDVPEPMNGMSATEALAAKLRSALASNAMGKSSNEEAKWRAAAEGVKEAQAAWARLAPVAGPDAHALEARIRDACRRVNDQARRHAPAPVSRQSGPGSRPSAPPRRTQPPQATAVTA